MPTTLSTIRTRVRQDLNDEDATNYRWTDARLQRHIEHTVRDYSLAHPIRTSATKATTNGSRDVTLDAVTFPSLIRVEKVEYPTGKYPPELAPFEAWGTTLTLLTDREPTGDNCKIFWTRQHTLDGSTSTIPTEHEDLIAIGAEAYAALEWASYAANRVNVDPRAVEHYDAFGKQRLAEFQAALAELTDRRRLRRRRLYTQLETATENKTTDWGP